LQQILCCNLLCYGMKDKKQCTKCNEKKGHDCFDKHPKSKDGLSPKCKECRKAYWKEYISRPKALKNHNERNQKRAKKMREEMTAMVRELKNEPCVDCGESYPYYVMDFDHVKGEKIGCVGRMKSQCCNKEKLLTEISKCDLVCSNCHRERTHQRSKEN
jgi:hypothetical protein